MKTSSTDLMIAGLFCAAVSYLAVTEARSVAVPPAPKDPAWLRISYPDGAMVPEMTVIHTTRPPSIEQVIPGIWQITFPPKP